MASESDSQEKTEDPTPKRIEKAMEEGQVLSSKDFLFYHFICRAICLFCSG